MNKDDVKITKKEIWREVKTLVIETQRATRLALLAIGFTMCGLTIPSLIKIFDYSLIAEALFVIVYFSFGIGIMVSEGLTLRTLKIEQEKSTKTK